MNHYLELLLRSCMVHNVFSTKTLSHLPHQTGRRPHEAIQPLHMNVQTKTYEIKICLISKFNNLIVFDIIIINLFMIPLNLDNTWKACELSTWTSLILENETCESNDSI